MWPLSAIFDLRRLAARTRREHGNDVVCPLLLTSEINERYSLPFLCPTREFFLAKRRVVLRFCDICKSRLNLPFIEESGSFVTPCERCYELVRPNRESRVRILFEDRMKLILCRVMCTSSYPRSVSFAVLEFCAGFAVLVTAAVCQSPIWCLPALEARLFLRYVFSFCGRRGGEAKAEGV